MFLPIAMILSVIISSLLGLSLLKDLSKEEDPVLQFIFGFFGFIVLFLAGGGIIGMLAKTFQWWGNSW